MADLFTERFDTPHAAWGSNDESFACDPGPGDFRYYFCPTSSIASGELTLVETTGLVFAKSDLARTTGRITRWRGQSSSSVNNIAVGNSKYSLFPSGPVDGYNGYPSWGYKSGELRLYVTTTPGSLSENQYIIDDGLTSGVDEQIDILVRATAGSFIVRLKSGHYCLIGVESTSTGDTCPAMSRGPAIVKDVRVVPTSFVVVPLVSHSFTQADGTSIGTSDGAGSQESGGSGVAFTEAGVGVEVSSNKLIASAEGVGYLTANVGRTDGTFMATLTPITGSPAELVVRWVDANNHWKIVVNSDNDTIKLIEVSSGTPTTRATGDIATESGNVVSGTAYTVAGWVYGNEIRAWIENIQVLHSHYINYTSASAHNTATSIGLGLNRGAGVASAQASHLVVFPHTLSDYPDLVDPVVSPAYVFMRTV